ncbi:hypothetical protein Q9R29_06490 [Rothia sp. ARF10]|nr:hypothetical protein [Rothia sp. ARF10]
MLPHEIDPGSGVRMVGGEIPEWSDLTPDPAPAAVERLVVAAAGRLAPGARVLLAGMPSARLRDRLPGTLDVSVLVRGLPDARALADGSTPHPSPTGTAGSTSTADSASSSNRARSTGAVIAGALDRLHAAGDTFDLVVALGGPEATLAPDSTITGARTWLRLVSELAGTEGDVVASVANPAGLDRLVGIGRPDGDEAWASVGDQHPEPLALPTLAGAGWDVLAAYPSLDDPGLVLTAEEVETSSGAGQLAVRALATGLDEREKLRDVWSTATTLLDAGLGVALAPAWVVVRGGASAAQAAPAVATDARLVESRLREAVASRSHTRTRTVVTAYAAWLAGLTFSGDATEGTRSTPASQARPASSAADLRDVLVDGAGAHSLVDGVRPSVAGGEDLERALRDFAERICADGTARLWVAPTPALVLADLLSMVGVSSNASSARGQAAGDSTPADAHPATDALDALDDADERPSPTSRQAVLLRLRAAEESLDETRRQVTWLEGTLRARDRRIRTLERAISVESSTAYKVVHQLGRPVPALKRRARAFLDRRGRG